MVMHAYPDGVRFRKVYRVADPVAEARHFRFVLAIERGVQSDLVRFSEREVWVIADDKQAVRFIVDGRGK